MKRLIMMLVASLCFASLVSAQTTKEHVVQRGETFAIIAKRYGMTEQQIKAANPTRKTCYVGLKLRIPVDKITTTSTQLTYTPPAKEKSPKNTPAREQKKRSKEEKKEKRKAFWRSVGEVASTVGDVLVGTTHVLAETGLLDNTGHVGDVMALSADAVGLARGEETNYIDHSKTGKKVRAEENGYDSSKSSSSKNTCVTGNDITGLQNRLDYVNQRLNVVNQQLSNLATARQKGQYAQQGAAAKSLSKQKKYQNVHNNTVDQRRRMMEAGVKAQQPHVNNLNNIDANRNKLMKEREALMDERRELQRRIKELQGIDTSSSSSGSGKAVHYESTYRRWENRVRDIYKSSHNGVTKGTGITLSQDKNMRDAQKEMQKTRLKALKENIIIKQSDWETVR